MADEVAGEGGDARHHHQVAEGEHGPQPAGGDDVAEEDEPVVVALEAPAAAQVDERQLGGFRDAGAHDGLGPHRHGPVGEHDGGVHGQARGEHAHAHEAAVADGEGEQGEERRRQEPPGGAATHRSGGQLQHDADRGQAGDDHDGVAQVGAQRLAQDADEGARQRSEEHGGHARRRYRGRWARTGRVSRVRGAGRGRRRPQRRR